jgi:hypothetical protein
MSTVKNYYTFGGELIGEQTTGQERIDYLTDPLGIDSPSTGAALRWRNQKPDISLPAKGKIRKGALVTFSKW